MLLKILALFYSNTLKNNTQKQWMLHFLSENVFNTVTTWMDGCRDPIFFSDT